MALRDDGWFDWAVRDPGPENRLQSAAETPLSVYVLHSMEGVYAYPGGYIVLRDPRAFPTAWNWTKSRGGTLYQHYSAFAHLQHGNAANPLGPGGELEGFAREAMTDGQLETELRIIRDINDYRARHGLGPLTRDETLAPWGSKRGLVLHREMAPPGWTQCPSDRYARLWAALEEEDEVTRQEYETLLLACFSGKEEVELPREQRLTNAAWRANEAAEGRRPSIGEAAASVAEHGHGGVER